MRIRVRFTRHFWERWEQLVGPSGGAREEVRRKLNAALKVGVRPDKTGAFHLRVRARAWVVVVPYQNGWRAITVHEGKSYEKRKARL